MFTIDDRLRGIPASREQVVALFQSINSPNLAVPGKKAGSAHAFVVGLRGSSGFGVFVYLYMPESQDCAVYVSSERTVSSGDYPQLESDAQAFVESMGFMMDNMNFRSLSAADQEQLIKTLPVFQKDPKSVPGAKPAPKETPAQALGRLFASF